MLQIINFIAVEFYHETEGNFVASQNVLKRVKVHPGSLLHA
jgi:hypothetical protein